MAEAIAVDAVPGDSLAVERDDLDGSGSEILRTFEALCRSAAADPEVEPRVALIRDHLSEVLNVAGAIRRIGEAVVEMKVKIDVAEIVRDMDYDTEIVKALAAIAKIVGATRGFTP